MSFGDWRRMVAQATGSNGRKKKRDDHAGLSTLIKDQ
jgi:hypothetical protein